MILHDSINKQVKKQWRKNPLRLSETSKSMKDIILWFYQSDTRSSNVLTFKIVDQLDSLEPLEGQGNSLQTSARRSRETADFLLEASRWTEIHLNTEVVQSIIRSQRDRPSVIEASRVGRSWWNWKHATRGEGWSRLEGSEAFRGNERIKEGRRRRQDEWVRSGFWTCEINLVSPGIFY